MAISAESIIAKAQPMPTAAHQVGAREERTAVVVVAAAVVAKAEEVVPLVGAEEALLAEERSRMADLPR